MSPSVSLLFSPISVPASPLFFNTGNPAVDLAIGGAAIGAGSGLVLGKIIVIMLTSWGRALSGLGSGSIMFGSDFKQVFLWDFEVGSLFEILRLNLKVVSLVWALYPWIHCAINIVLMNFFSLSYCLISFRHPQASQTRPGPDVQRGWSPDL